MLQLSPIRHALHLVSINSQWTDRLSITHTKIYIVGQNNALHLPQQSKQCLSASPHYGLPSVKAPAKSTSRTLFPHFNSMSMHRALFLAMRENQEFLGSSSSPSKDSVHMHLVPFTSHTARHTSATPPREEPATWIPTIQEVQPK